MHFWRVEYLGFLQVVQRDFVTYEQALQWVRQVGQARQAKITLCRANQEAKPS
jgi:hypothetical protein